MSYIGWKFVSITRQFQPIRHFCPNLIPRYETSLMLEEHIKLSPNSTMLLPPVDIYELFPIEHPPLKIISFPLSSRVIPSFGYIDTVWKPKRIIPVFISGASIVIFPFKERNVGLYKRIGNFTACLKGKYLKLKYKLDKILLKSFLLVQICSSKCMLNLLF